MPSIPDAFRTTLDLFETGLDSMRQNFRRTHPEASDEEIERLLHEWLRDRPGAESGDALLRVAPSVELVRARHALTLIATRGYQRGRNLDAELNSLLGSQSGSSPRESNEPEDK